jgi:hypothetical protein
VASGGSSGWAPPPTLPFYRSNGRIIEDRGGIGHLEVAYHETGLSVTLLMV